MKSIALATTLTAIARSARKRGWSFVGSLMSASIPAWALVLSAVQAACANGVGPADEPWVIIAPGADPGVDSGRGAEGAADSGSDGDNRANDSGNSAPSPRQDAFIGASPFVTTMGETSHNAGLSCNTAGCHQFLLGGTIYRDYKGTVPAPGVEVRLRDMAGNTVSVFTGPNGNFRLDANARLTLPAIVGARDATTTRPMITTLSSAMGSCAAAGCHVVGGSPAAGAYFPIHVP